MQCPNCQTRLVHRAALRGLREFLWSLLTVYPFRCQLCTHRFVAFQGRPSYNPQREYHRVRVRYAASFVPSRVETQDIRGTGIMVNLSIRGCGIESEVPLHRGTSVLLKFEVGERGQWVEVERAAVRFTEGQRAGLEFLKMSPDQEERLRQIMEARLSGQPTCTLSNPRSLVGAAQSSAAVGVAEDGESV